MFERRGGRRWYARQRKRNTSGGQGLGLVKLREVYVRQAGDVPCGSGRCDACNNRYHVAQQGVWCCGLSYADTAVGELRSALKLQGRQHVLSATAPLYVIPDASVLVDVRAMWLVVLMVVILIAACATQLFDVVESCSLMTDVVLLQTVVRLAAGVCPATRALAVMLHLHVARRRWIK